MLEKKACLRPKKDGRRVAGKSINLEVNEYGGRDG